MRSITAYLLMTAFIIATTVGSTMEFGLGVGLITLGVVSGICGYLLGAE